MMLSTLEVTIGPGAATFFGSGALRRLPEATARLGHDKAFLVTDAGVSGAGIAAQVEAVLRSAGMATTAFDCVRPNPSVSDLDGGGQAIRAFGPGTVVAVGGGAVMDVAKALALMATNEGSARDFDYRRAPRHPGLPVVAIPTTAGTVSETNSWGVIDDPGAHRKFYVGHESVTPRVSILDPELTRGLPPGQTAASGMDAMAHALESLSSRRSNPYAEGLGLQVVTMVAAHLPEAFSDGLNMEARAHMLLAAHMAGLGFQTTGLGLCHAIGHALSARLGTPHGVALSVVLPHVLSFNLPVRARTYAQVALALGVSDNRRDDAQGARAAIDAVRQLSRRVRLPASLRELGCTEDLLGDVVEDALADVVIENTPRAPARDELRALLVEAL